MDEQWRTRARCHGLGDVFAPEEGGGVGTAMAKRALHLCVAHCPVKRQCREFAEGKRWVSIVVAGKRYDNDGKVMRTVAPPFCAGCWSGS